MEEALTSFQDQDLIVIWYISAYIRKSQNPRIQQVADLLMELGLIDLLHHFQKRWRYQHMKTWYQVR